MQNTEVVSISGAAGAGKKTTIKELVNKYGRHFYNLEWSHTGQNPNISDWRERYLLNTEDLLSASTIPDSFRERGRIGLFKQGTYWDIPVRELTDSLKEKWPTLNTRIRDGLRDDPHFDIAQVDLGPIAKQIQDLPLPFGKEVFGHIYILDHAVRTIAKFRKNDPNRIDRVKFPVGISRFIWLAIGHLHPLWTTVYRCDELVDGQLCVSTPAQVAHGLFELMWYENRIPF